MLLLYLLANEKLQFTLMLLCILICLDYMRCIDAHPVRKMATSINALLCLIYQIKQLMRVFSEYGNEYLSLFYYGHHC